ncbi:unnamed protein product [Bubo scandiacus]
MAAEPLPSRRWSVGAAADLPSKPSCFFHVYYHSRENTHSLHHFLFCHKFALDGFFSSLRHERIMQKRNVSITLCILGLIDTDMASQNTRGKVHITASPGPEAALTIIQGGATRVQEVFYPWWLQHMCSLWVLFPNDRDQVLQSYYNYSSP